MKRTIVTNNDYVRDKYKDDFDMIYIDKVDNYTGVLLKARDLIHEGYKLLTHPLSGSVKPNETPFKTIILEKGTGLDQDGLIIIEEAIGAINKFLNIEKTPDYNERVIDDCKVIDLSIIDNTINLRSSI